MKPSVRRLRRIRAALLVAIAALLAIELIVVALGARDTSGQGSAGAPTAPLAAGAPLDEPLPSLAVLDEHGHTTSLAAFRGKYLVLAPSLTLCHEVCPMTTGALMQLRRRLAGEGLGGRVVVAEATVDPWRDSPARVRAFEHRTGADLRFLTGTPAQIRRLWRFFGVDYERVPEGRPPDIDWWTHRAQTFDVQHTDGVFIIDPRGRWRVAVSGMPNPGGRLSPKLSSLLNAEGKANLRHPDTAWTVDGVLHDLLALMGRRPPRTAATPSSAPPSASQVRSALRGSPAALAALHAQGGRLLDGGGSAFKARLARLRGHPVVVNEWASWCPPCQNEFPFFADASVRYGTRVGFVGLDVNDGAGSARAFVAKHPVSYPSYSDDGGKASDWLGRSIGLPTTVFLDARGKVISTHVGQYRDVAALAADIDRHALGGHP